MKNLIPFLLATFLIFSCERKKFDNPYDPKNRLGPPKLINPQDGEVCDLNPPIFEWENLGAKAGYEIWLDTSNRFDAETVFYCYSDSPYVILGNYLYFEDFTYFWRVRATMDRTISPKPWGKWSKSSSFAVKIPFVSTFQCSSDIYDFKALNNIVFIMDNTGYLSVFDFTDAGSPLLLLHYQVGNENYKICKVSNQFLYLSSMQSDSIKILLLEIDNLPSISVYYEFSYPSANVSDLSFYNYIVGIRKEHYYEPDTIVLFDVSNLDSIKEGEFESNYFNLSAFWIYENIVSLCTNYRIYIYDISNITLPTLKDSLVFQEYSVFFLGIENTYLYVFNVNAVYIFNIYNPLSPVLVSTFSTNAYMKKVENGYLIAGYDSSKQFYKLLTPTTPQYIGGLCNISFYSFAVSNKYILSKSSSDEFKIFKINE